MTKERVYIHVDKVVPPRFLSFPVGNWQKSSKAVLVVGTCIIGNWQKVPRFSRRQLAKGSKVPSRQLAKSSRCPSRQLAKGSMVSQ